MKIRVKDDEFVSYAKDKLYKTKYFENMLLLLIHRDFKQKEKKFCHLYFLSSIHSNEINYIYC